MIFRARRPYFTIRNRYPKCQKMSKKATTRPQAIHWIVVINNYSKEEEELFNNPLYFRYAVFGREKGENGTPHLQGYVALYKKQLLSAMKKLFPRAHLEVKSRLSTPKQCADYCKKDMDYVEYGEVPLAQGEAGAFKNQQIWDDTRELLKQGKIDEVNSKIFITHYSTLKKIISDTEAVPADLTYKAADVPNEWIYGPTRTGKSFKAKSENPGHYLKMCNKWWDNYAGEDVAIIEDLGQSHLYLGDHLKVWADRYGFRAEIKHATKVLRPKRIIVTSNYHPEELWTDKGVLEPILARFKITHLTEKWKDPEEPLENAFDKLFQTPEVRADLKLAMKAVEKEMKDKKCLMCYLQPCNCLDLRNK